MMRKWLIAAVAVLVALPLVGWGLVQMPAVQDWLVSTGVQKLASQTKLMNTDPNSMRVVFCGTEPPPPSRVRAKSCTAIMVGNRTFIVDTGPGSANKMSMWRFPMQRLTAVLLTHFHSDHIGDLGEFRLQSWVSGRTVPLPVYGPDGVEKVVDGFNLAYSPDDSYRAPEHHLSAAAAQLAAKPFGLASAAERATHMASRTIYDQDGLRITAFQVMHEPVYPAVGYRFDYRGRSVVVSGDTTISPNLVRMAKGVDVLVHEGQSREAQQIFVNALKKSGDTHLARVIGEVGNYHATPVQVAEEANQAGVGLLVFNHMGPIPPDNLITKKLFARGLSDVRPASKWHLANDGLILTLPVGSKAVDRSRLP